MQVRRFDNATDFTTQAQVVELYRGTFDIAPIMHQILVGNGLGELYLCWPQKPTIPIGALVLKSPEAVMPIGADCAPLAWVVSDVVTHEGYRGRGVGLTMLRSVEPLVWRRGGRIIYLFCDQANEAARGLYLKAGYCRLQDQGRNVVFVKLREPRSPNGQN